MAVWIKKYKSYFKLFEFLKRNFSKFINVEAKKNIDNLEIYNINDIELFSNKISYSNPNISTDIFLIY